MNHNSKTLQEIKGDDKTVFTYNVLQEMREGKIKSNHPLFDILHHVRDIIPTEAYDTFSEFMSKLRTDSKSVQEPDNVVRIVYEGFKNGAPQRWKLIEPVELQRCIQHYSCPKPLSGANDDYWVAKIMGWVASAKNNIAQLAANSYLCSGPTLEQDSENSQGQNLHALLWYDLTGDEEIPYRARQCGKDSIAERVFFDNYWRPFVKYIGTKYGEGVETSETDSPLDGLFNVVAEFDKNLSNSKELLVTLDRLKYLRHHRGGFAHIFMNR